MLAIYGPQEVGARTCPRRRWMLAIYGPQEIGARHLSKDAAGC